MSNSKSLLIGGGALLLVAAGAGVWLARPASPAEKTMAAQAEVKAEGERTKPQPMAAGGGQAAEGNTSTIPSGNPASELTPEQKRTAAEERESVMVILDEAATTYDPAQLPVVDKYLYHTDPEIRKAAKDSMVVLGDSGAGKLLRKAAESAASEEERKAMIEAAEYMELPALDPRTFAEQMKKSANNPDRKTQQPGIGSNMPPQLQRIIRGSQQDPASPATAPPAAPAPVTGQ